MSKQTISQLPKSVAEYVRSAYQPLCYLHPSLNELYPLMDDEYDPEVVSMLVEFKTFEKERRSFEAVFINRMIPILARARSAVLADYRAGSTPLHIGRAAERELKNLAPIIRSLYDTVGLHFAKRARAQVKDEFDKVDLNDMPELVQYNRTMTAAKVTLISTATRDGIRRSLDRALRDGTSSDIVARELKDSYKFSSRRAKLIVQTEIVAASNAGTHFSLDKFLRADNMTKAWLNAGDLRVRHTHIVAGATQTKVAFDKPFEVGGSKLMFPGDTSLGAKPKETISCRCTVTYKRKSQTRPLSQAQPDPTARNLLAVAQAVKPKPKPKKLTPKQKTAKFDKLKADFKAFTLNRKKKVDALSRKQWTLMKEKVALEKQLRAVPTGMNSPAGKLLQERIAAKSREIAKFTEAINRLATSEQLWVAKHFSEGAGSIVIQSTKVLGDTPIEAGKWLNSLVGKNYKHTQSIQVKALPRGGRAFNRRGVSHVAPEDPVHVIIHEMGHGLEHRGRKAYTSANKFLEDRTKQDLYTKQLYPNDPKHASEMFKEDKWKATGNSNYTGKIYQGDGTEILSMGLQRLYQNPTSFFNRDPEFVRMLWNLFN
jgi:hypothetical protein